MDGSYFIPGVYRRPKERAEGFPRVRTDVAGFVGAAGPRHLGRAVAVEDWKSYVALFHRDDNGRPVDAPRGGALQAAVRDYFANGGRRLWIANVAESIDPARKQEFLNDMLGLGHALDPHGLELLLRQDEVALVALPDLDAVSEITEDRTDDGALPGNPCFRRCSTLVPTGIPQGHRAARAVSQERLFAADDLMAAQRYLIERLRREPWRCFAVLAPPPGLDAPQAVRWRERLTRGSEGADVAALYWPWLLTQDSPGAPTALRSPVGAVTGVFAATDISDGPHVAPANRRLTGVVGVERGIGDEDNRIAYNAGVNVIRAFPGQGILLWGARTLLWLDELSRGKPLAFVNCRRCLSAVARSTWVVGQPVVFQPNTALPRIQLHQMMTGYLLQVFASGALMGDLPDQAFFVEVVPAEESPEGQIICRIGLALAAPAEFIVFRVGRQDGVIETAEAA